MAIASGSGRIVALAAGLALGGAGAATAADPEALRAATVKITVEHGGESSPSSGSGIILCQQAGRVEILTAKHVVTGVGLVDESGPTGRRFRDVRTIEVAFYRNRPPPVRLSPAEALIQKAAFKDVALVTLSGIEVPLSVARLGSATALRTGHRIESVGHLDVDWDWTDGSVRSAGEFIRHSAPADHGYSGGPLFNAAGQVVGVNLQMVRGVARAMPIDEAMLPVRRWIDPVCLGGVPAPAPLPPVVAAPPPARPAAGDRKVERVAGVELAWRYAPPGSFRMGSPASEPQRDDDETPHQVRLTRGFWIGETEVTQGQWQALMGNNPSTFGSCAECPVEQVNWYEAISFANALSKRSGLEECYELAGCNGKQAGEDLECSEVRFEGLECRGYRLPTEAEWEYAARATTTTPFSTGDNLTTEQANYNGNFPYEGYPKGKYRQKAVEVRSFDANRWGLYEVHGNVWEWTQDAAEWMGKVETATYKDGVENPLSTRGAWRVYRGGCWRVSARRCRAAYRDAYPPGGRGDNLGFRLVRTSP